MLWSYFFDVQQADGQWVSEHLWALRVADNVHVSSATFDASWDTEAALTEAKRLFETVFRILCIGVRT